MKLLRGDSWLSQGLRCLNILCLALYHLYVRNFFVYNQADAKGREGCGVCGKDQFTEGQNPNYGSARFPKARNINEIQSLL